MRIRRRGDVLVLREGEQRLHSARLLYDVVVVLTNSVVVLTNSVVVLTNSVVVLNTLREGEQRVDTARLLQQFGI